MDRSKVRCSAFDYALNLLSYKDRTVCEIKQKLSEKGYSFEEINDAVEKLSYYGYLNDQNYTISYIKNNTSKKGKKLIKCELNKKGIEKNLFEEIYESSEVNEEDVIRNILNRRFNLMDLKDEKNYRRVINFFMRRGFSFDNIRKVIKNNDMYNSEDVF